MFVLVHHEVSLALGRSRCPAVVRNVSLRVYRYQPQVQELWVSYDFVIQEVLLYHYSIHSLWVPEGQETKAPRPACCCVSHDCALLDFAELRKVIPKRFCEKTVSVSIHRWVHLRLTVGCFPIQTANEHFAKKIASSAAAPSRSWAQLHEKRSTKSREINVSDIRLKRLQQM